MNCTTKITIIGYTVKYVDMREPKPRTIHDGLYTMDRGCMEMLTTLGQNIPDFIAATYARSGYHVIDVERIAAKRVSTVDLSQLWELAENALRKNPAAPSDSEDCPE